jgi:hypothetical protein
MTDAEPYIERVIREATERGELAPGSGLGEPIEGLDRDDPNWWARSWVERDRASQASAALSAAAVRGVAAALRADDDTCRRTITDLNEEIRIHNRAVDETERLPLLDVELIASRRGRVPRSWGDTRDPGRGNA